MMAPTRRQFLVSGAATVGAVSVSGAATGSDRGPLEYDSIPEFASEEFDVELDYDAEFLREFRPALIAPRHLMQRSEFLLGYRARADHYDVDAVACYWHRLTHQDGLPLLAPDGHLYDHEPAYVFVEGGSVDRVVYTEWHHFASVLDGEDLTRALIEHETGSETHVPLRIVDPWHQYDVEPDPPETETNFVDVEGDDELSTLRTWETRGIFDSTAAEAIYDPSTVEDRGSWWDESTWDYRVASAYRRLAQYIDIGGSGEAL